MLHRKTLLVIGVVTMLVIGGSGLAAAHDWQTEVEQGDKVLGVNSAPEDPIAGMETEFSGSITDNAAAEGQDNRTSWGGVTNKELEVHINGPGEIHDHVTTHVPEDDSHFHFGYVFPEPGEYSITIVTTIDGEEYAFEFQRTVSLLPARAEGEMVENIGANVTALQEQVDELNGQVDELNGQIDELNGQVDELNAQDDETDDGSTPLTGLGLAIGLAGLAIVGGFFVGRRT